MTEFDSVAVCCFGVKMSPDNITTRSLAQKPVCMDLGRNGQRPAISPKAAYAPVSNRAGSRSLCANAYLRVQ
ncbi:hypothetical protein FEI15_13520 [Lacticaseibacillus zeae]|uniref:Alpha-galactosidase n=1 Tax=Lacticaseibacillus zeae TaxID=57037 RepID=A0A5R8LJ91_LACZE|nr:hypothetical protein FEI15_13520 [Lacticaseibacillus zeae]